MAPSEAEQAAPPVPDTSIGSATSMRPESAASYDIPAQDVLSTSQKALNAVLGMATLALVVPFLLEICLSAMAAVEAADDLLMAAKHVYWYLGNNISAFPLYFFSLCAIFALQWITPARSAQRQFGSSVKTDMLFSVAMLGFYATVAPAYISHLKDLANQFVPAFEVFRGDDLPVVTQVLVGYLAVDFLGWLHHLVRHKVPVFWDFHAVHHSQEELNPFSNERVHVFDWFISNAIKFIPAFLFTESIGIVLNYIVIHQFLDHLNHANVRTNLGPLKYILVTPQSHRVHHSSQREHFDLNYGVSLSIWDHLFGTQHRDYDVYPATGIPDKSYPYEGTPGGGNPWLSFLRQQMYPFKKILKYYR